MQQKHNKIKVTVTFRMADKVKWETDHLNAEFHAFIRYRKLGTQ